MMSTVVRAEAAVLPGGVVRDVAVVVANRRIRSVGPAAAAPAGSREVTVAGTLLPGLVDIQVNGMGGRGCEEDRDDALDVVARAAWSGGAAAFLPTLITAPMDALVARCERVARFIESFDADHDAAMPVGIHLEGPFLEVAGAHEAQHLVAPTRERVDALLGACRGHLRVLTLSPDLPGAAEATARLTAAGVSVALGHARHSAHLADCVAAGANHVTHLFNAMSGLHHRDPGIVGFALDDERLSCGIILDGIHVHPAAARIACRVLGTERTLLVTDAANPAGMPDGDYELSGMPVSLRNGAVRDATGTLAGSALTMADAATFYLRTIPGADAAALARVGATNPARIARAEGFGCLEVGALGRFAVLGQDGRVQSLRV
jgi:N-acetylglucosamine-6-phosphate deacetylase